jgi:hypothetical protein
MDLGKGRRFLGVRQGWLSLLSAREVEAAAKCSLFSSDVSQFGLDLFFLFLELSLVIGISSVRFMPLWCMPFMK